MKKYLIILLLAIISLPLHSQEDEHVAHGTIRVQKSGTLVKTVYDNVNYRLVGIDQYGNVLDTAILEFKMFVTIKGIAYDEYAKGPYLSLKMQQILGKCDQSSKVYFSKIKARDRNGTLVSMPNFIYTIGFTPEHDE
jgi:hypothetical protein